MKRRKKGKIKLLKYDTSTLQFVKDYDYLDVTLTTSGLFNENVKRMCNHSAILNLKTHDDHKNGCMECQKMFRAVVASTLL